jgi:hypothetical protein
MYVVTSIPFVRRTRATLRNAEFGFFGVVVYTRTHTPRRWGQDMRAGEAVLRRWAGRPDFTSWLIVGMLSLLVFRPVLPVLLMVVGRCAIGRGDRFRARGDAL